MLAGIIVEESARVDAIVELADRLSHTRVLLLLDDVWEENVPVYRLVDRLTLEPSRDDCESKVLLSTRQRPVATKHTHIREVAVLPRAANGELANRILECYAYGSRKSKDPL